MSVEDDLAAIITILSQNQNPTKAETMAKYMKNNFLYLGIPKSEMRSLQQNWIKYNSTTPTMKYELIKQLWIQPHREYQYVAIDLLFKQQSKLNLDDIAFVEYLILNKPWWDTVDMLATNFLGSLLLANPTLATSHIRPWAHCRGENTLWLRRSAIISQLKFKRNTDLGLLEEVILANCNTKEFFLNKAIGWSLREYSKTDGKWVRNFVKKYPLHPLSIREALKFLKK